MKSRNVTLRATECIWKFPRLSYREKKLAHFLTLTGYDDAFAYPEKASSSKNAEKGH